MAGTKGDPHDSDTSKHGPERAVSSRSLRDPVDSGMMPDPPPEEGIDFRDSGASDDEEKNEPDFKGPTMEGPESDLELPPEAQFDPYLQEEAQLSPEKRVPEDMGTIALEGVPRGQSKVNPLPPSLSGGAIGNLEQMTDAEIMQKAAAGDESCFDFLVIKYRRPIIGFMYRMVHNQAVAEELAQEVFLRVYRARESYRAEARFTTWLYRIAANMAINHARDTKHERASSSVYLDQADEDTGAKPDLADIRPTADRNMLRDERMRHIREHVLALPERQRMAVIMHKYQDMDYKQIGSVLKLSESATKSLLFRAYQTLRDRLKEFA